MVYTLTCNPAIDYVVQLDAPLTGGAINRSHQEVYQFGGKGINVSNVLRALDQPTVALGFVAGFTGRALEENLRQMGLVTDFIHLSQGHTRINVKVKSDLETEINGAGPEIDQTALQALDEQLDQRYTDGIECEGFALIADGGDQNIVAIHRMSVDGISDAMKNEDKLMSAAILAKAKREIIDIAMRQNKGRDMLRTLLGMED